MHNTKQLSAYALGTLLAQALRAHARKSRAGARSMGRRSAYTCAGAVASALRLCSLPDGSAHIYSTCQKAPYANDS